MVDLSPIRYIAGASIVGYLVYSIALAVHAGMRDRRSQFYLWLFFASVITLVTIITEVLLS